MKSATYKSREFNYQSKRALAAQIDNYRMNGVKWSGIAYLLNARRIRRPRHDAPWTRPSAEAFYYRHVGKRYSWPGRPNKRPNSPEECLDGLRPCPFATCRGHMAHLHMRVDSHDTRPESYVMAAVEAGDFEGLETCVHDLVGARGAMTNSQIAEELGVSREQVRRMVNSAMDSACETDPDIGERLRRWYRYSSTIKAERDA